MRLSIKIIMGAAIVAASVAVASFGASAPANASELRAAQTASDMSARKKSVTHPRSTSLRVAKLSRRATEPPNPDRPYYRPVPHFYPFAQTRGYF